MSKILNYDKINYSKKVKYKESIVLRLNSNKAKKELMWTPKFTISQTLYKTADWYNRYIKKDDIFKKTLDDIKEYFN